MCTWPTTTRFHFFLFSSIRSAKNLILEVGVDRIFAPAQNSALKYFNFPSISKVTQANTTDKLKILNV